jgi:uncharacterized protein (UPF0332 family)
VPVPDPAHLLEQAERFAAASAEGQPRDSDLRRAISTAYYAIFHAILTAGADLFVGNTKRATGLYALAYRSIDHQKLRNVCKEVSKQTPSDRYKAYIPAGGLGPKITALAEAAVLLQAKRYEADYDPLFAAGQTDVELVLKQAREALDALQSATEEQRNAFLGLLLFEPRGTPKAE